MDQKRIGLTISMWAVVLFLNFPFLIVLLYAFTTDNATLTFPLPGFTFEWFGKAFARADMWASFSLSFRVATVSTLTAMILGTLAAAAVYRSKFFGREAISFLLLLPIALPGIVTGIALRSMMSLAGFDFNFWTIVIGHATFCIVVVYNNVIARFRRMNPSLIEASMDLGADGWQTFWKVVFPNISTALLAGGMLAFALSLDEVIVTTFTAGNQETLPIWIFSQLTKPRDRPITNVVAFFVVAITFLPLLWALKTTQKFEEHDK
jgi:putative spermidine/putrescine transport system permease protein